MGRGYRAVGGDPSSTWSSPRTACWGHSGPLHLKQHVPVLCGWRSHPSQPREFSKALTLLRRPLPWALHWDYWDTWDYSRLWSWPVRAVWVLRVGNPGWSRQTRFWTATDPPRRRKRPPTRLPTSSRSQAQSSVDWPINLPQRWLGLTEVGGQFKFPNIGKGREETASGSWGWTTESNWRQGKVFKVQFRNCGKLWEPYKPNSQDPCVSENHTTCWGSSGSPNTSRNVIIWFLVHLFLPW